MKQVFIILFCICAIHSFASERDTIKGFFYFEQFVTGYIDFDAIVQSGGYIVASNNIPASYAKGYYRLDWGTDSFRKQHQIDSSSVNSLWLDTYTNQIFHGDSGTINPYCGVYLTSYYLEIEVEPMGLCAYRIPKFKSCDSLATENKHYDTKQVNTFLITKVFKFQRG